MQLCGGLQAKKKVEHFLNSVEAFRVGTCVMGWTNMKLSFLHQVKTEEKPLGAVSDNEEPDIVPDSQETQPLGMELNGAFS